MSPKWFLTPFVLGLLSVAASGAEIQLRSDARVQRNFVTLGDVAEIFGAGDAESHRLAALELTAAPAQGNRLHLRAREIQDLLTLRDESPAKHQFSGAAEVTVVRAIESAKKTTARRPDKLFASQAQQKAADAIARYLRTTVADETWQVVVPLDDDQADAIGKAKTLSVAGGERPWVGQQSFEITAATDQGSATVEVQGQVALPPAVVVAIHSVPRGAVVRAADIQLQRLAAGTVTRASFQTADEVIGKEALKNITPGQTLDDNSIRAPIWVHGGEVVTVTARNSGIAIRMPVRCRENGGQGDLVMVESLQDRKTFLARVSGLQEVEVYGGAAAVSATSSADRPSDSRN